MDDPIEGEDDVALDVTHMIWTNKTIFEKMAETTSSGQGRAPRRRGRRGCTLTHKTSFWARQGRARAENYLKHIRSLRK